MTSRSIGCWIAGITFMLAGCTHVDPTSPARVDALYVARDVVGDGVFSAGIEGPAWGPDGALYAVSFERDGTIGRVTFDAQGNGTASLFVTLPTGSTGNGIRFDVDGTLYVADYSGHQILRIPQGTQRVVVHASLPQANQPNDIARSPDGTLYASDPNWKTGTGQVWRITPDGRCHLESGDMGTTNGIEVSPDGRRVYVNESVQRNIWVFDRATNGSLSNKRLLRKFDDFGFDGMRADVDGNLYVTRHGKGTVVKLSSKGEILREVDVLGPNPSNICFGGPDGCTAYVTEAKSMRVVQFRVDRPGLEWSRWKR